MKPGLILDFDGTVTERDVGAEIVQTFAAPGWQQGYGRYHTGEFGGRQAMEWEYRHLPVRRREEMIEYAHRNGVLRAGLRELIDFCRERGIPVEIASNGMDFYIRTVLDRDGFSDLPFVSPTAVFGAADAVDVSFAAGLEACDRTGLCKCARVRRLRARGCTVVYAGDGVSDYCVAGEAEVVLARAALVTYCEENGIPHIPFMTMDDVRAELERLLRSDAAATGEERRA